MRALVIYDSMFGNTKAVAEAVAEGLFEFLPTDVVEVGRAPQVDWSGRRRAGSRWPYPRFQLEPEPNSR